jgi:hypothetical protein
MSDAQLTHAAANTAPVAEVPKRNPINSNAYASSILAVTQTQQPLPKEVPAILG